MDRIATFQTFIARTPTDPFPRYGLAMEFRARGLREESVAAFDALVADFPDYVPTYLMAGTNLTEMGRIAAARAMYQAGIAAAQRKGDRHALGELEGALAALPE